MHVREIENILTINIGKKEIYLESPISTKDLLKFLSQLSDGYEYNIVPKKVVEHLDEKHYSYV